MIHGGCQCGKACYEADGEISDLSDCHCSMCRKLHGAAFATFAAVARDGFRWSGGDDDIRTYASSDKIDRVFCGNCGSQLIVYYRPEPDLVYLTMGTVDGNPDAPPAYHQFVGSRAPWYEITDGQPQHETWPDEST
ncbi:MAG: GFA family protein [Woeseia sp.]